MATLQETYDQLDRASRQLRQRLASAENRQIAQALDYATQKVNTAAQRVSAAHRATPNDQALLLAECARHLNEAAAAVNSAIGQSPELRSVLVCLEEVKVTAREMSAVPVKAPLPNLEATTPGGTETSVETAQALAALAGEIVDTLQGSLAQMPPAQRDEANNMVRELRDLSARFTALAGDASQDWSARDKANVWSAAYTRLGSLAGYASRSRLRDLAPSLAALAQQSRTGIEQLRSEYRDNASSAPEASAVEAESLPVQAEPAVQPTRSVSVRASTSPTPQPAAPEPHEALLEAAQKLGKVRVDNYSDLHALYSLDASDADRLARDLPEVAHRLYVAAQALELAQTDERRAAIWAKVDADLAVLDMDTFGKITEVRSLHSLAARKGEPHRMKVPVRAAASPGRYNGRD